MEIATKSRRKPWRWFSGFGVLLVSGVALVPSCVCEHPHAKPEPNRNEVAFFDFVAPSEPSALELWPAESQAPARKKHAVIAKSQGADLVTTNDGRDPFLVWDFETPIRAGSLAVTLFASASGALQLFWSNEDCKTYEERCSTTIELKPGDQSAAFVLDARRPLRGLRLDLPEEADASLAFHRIRLLARPRLQTGFEPRAEHTLAEPTPQGLRISSKSDDPWLIFPTPWLDASRVSSVEIEMAAPADASPQLYFLAAVCPNFSETCQARFERVEDQRDTFRAPIGEAANWSGKIGSVRLDPGDQAGVYMLRRLTFVGPRESASH